MSASTSGLAARAAQTAAIRAAVPLLELAQEAAPGLRRTGAEWRGPCPIHGGEGPNFSVNPARGVWHCHTCGAGGDVFDLARQWRGLSDFTAARAWLAQRAGIPLDDAPLDVHPQGYDVARAALPGARETPAETPAPWSARSTETRAAAAAEWRRRTRAEGGTWQEPTAVYTALRDALALSDAARTYLAGRGLDPDAAFGWGVRSVDDWSALPALLDELGIDAWEAVAAGLDVAPAYVLPDGRTEARPARSVSPVYAVANLPALVFFYVGRGGRAVGARLRTMATADQLQGAGLDPTRTRYLSLRGNQPRLPWGADALAACAGQDLHVCEGEPDALTLRTYGLTAIALPGAQSVPGLADANGDARRVPWLRAAGAAGRVLLWHDPDEGGDRGAPRLRNALQAAHGWTAAQTAQRVVRVRPHLADVAGGKVDANALHQAGRLGALLAAAGLTA